MDNKASAPKIEKAMLCIIEDEGCFEGYLNGDTWNGWECPLFTKDTAIRIGEAYSDESATLTYDEQQDCFKLEFIKDGFIDIYEGSDYDVDGETLHLYPIGSHVLCWDKAIGQEVNENCNQNMTL